MMKERNQSRMERRRPGLGRRNFHLISARFNPRYSTRSIYKNLEGKHISGQKAFDANAHQDAGPARNRSTTSLVRTNDPRTGPGSVLISRSSKASMEVLSSSSADF